MSIVKVDLNAKIYLELTEGEAMALDAICGYGPDKFLEWFYKNHGTHYMQTWAPHLVTLFDKARKLKGAVDKVKGARDQLKIIHV